MGGVDLGGVDLGGLIWERLVDLGEIDLGKVDLEKVDLGGIYLGGVYLRGANLGGVGFVFLGGGVNYLPLRVTSCNCSREVGSAAKDPEVGPFLTSTIKFELPILLPSFTLIMNLYLEPGARTLALRTREVNDVPVLY